MLKAHIINIFPRPIFTRTKYNTVTAHCMVEVYHKFSLINKTIINWETAL